MVGALGAIFLVALALWGQKASPRLWDAFYSYFSGGQIGLTILSVGGVTFIALLRHKPTHPILAVLLYIFLFGPMVITAFLIGLNPGFIPNGLSQDVLRWLWWIFFGLHALWFFTLLLEPVIPNAQEAGEAQEKRVRDIKARAVDRA
ncbi:hypothetical protein RTM1035_05873 [Roseovarius sp. TM1035]|nr:hypothetical protein RTM1035_05873 [Roseovarius sp. TM1035]